MNLPEILIPHINIRVVEIEALHLARHVGRANDRQRTAIYCEIIAIDGEMRAGAEKIFVAYPKAGVVASADAVAIDQLRLDDVEALVRWRWQKDWLVRMKWDRGGCAVPTL